MAAAATQNQITDDRNIVIGLNWPPAFGTSRIGKDDRLFARQAMNDDVEKASNDCSHHAQECAGDRYWHIEGAIYRHHIHSGEHCNAAADLMPTDFCRRSVTDPRAVASGIKALLVVANRVY